jgi:hypothetical protein
MPHPLDDMWRQILLHRAAADLSELGPEDGQFFDLPAAQGSPLAPPPPPYRLKGRGLMDPEVLDAPSVGWTERLGHLGHRPAWQEVDPGMAVPLQADPAAMPQPPQENLNQMPNTEVDGWLEALMRRRQQQGFG